MTPDVASRKARLEAILARLRTNRQRLGHPGAEDVPPIDDFLEPVTAPLRLGLRPAPAVIPVAPLVPAPAAGPAPLPPPAAAVPPEPEPELPERVTWEGEDEEEMILEEAPEGVVEKEAAVADESPLAVAPEPVDVEEEAPVAGEVPPPPALPTMTVTPSAVPAVEPAPLRPAPAPRVSAEPAPPAPEPAPPHPVVRPPAVPAPAVPVAAAEVRAERIEASPPPGGIVVRSVGEVEAVRPRTIGELLGAALRLFDKG
ncbi:MAG: hypothetical protein HY905_12700 [Deltaproteobacteria bacterium]|nr:hypothetical protein [Deltaproteobacteria bacterium]